MKKIFSIVLSLCMILTMLPLNVFASAEQNLVFTVGNVVVDENATSAIVPVTIADGNPGFLALTIGFVLPEGMTLNSKKTKLVGDFLEYAGVTKGAKFVIMAQDATEDITISGVLLNIQVDIAETVENGTYPISIEIPDNGAKNFAEEQVPYTIIPGSITVGTPKSDFPADIALGTKEFTYDGTAKSLTEADITGTLPEGTAVTFEGNGVTDAGEYTVKATLKADGYNDKTVEGKIKINPKELTVTGFDAYDRIYNGTDVVSLKPGTLTGVVDGDDVTHVVSQKGRAGSKNVGITAIIFDPITLTGADAGNYTLKQPGQWVEIKAKEVKVTVEDVTKYVGEAKASITANYDATDLIAGDTVNLTGEPACDVDINADGDYPITVGTLAFDNTNYVVKFKGGTYTVLPKGAQYSTVTGYSSVVYGHEGFTLEIDPYIPGGKYTINNKTPNVVAVDENDKVTILNAGDAKLEVVFEGNTEYNPQSVPVKFNVAKREIGFTADSFEVKVGEAEKTLTYKVTTGKFGYSDEAVVVLERQPGTAVGEYAITFKSVVIMDEDGRDVTSNYIVTTTPGVYKIVDKNIQQVAVTAPEGFKYGEKTTAKIDVTLDAAAKADGCETVTYSVASANPESCMTVDNSGNITVNGAGTATFTVKVNGTTNYAEFTKDVTLTVAKREITIVPDAGQFKYAGKADPDEFGYTTTGDTLVAGDAFSGKLGRVPGEEAGTYDFTIGDLAVNNNYKLTLDTTNKFEIKAPHEQTISFPAIPVKTYGDDAFNLNVVPTTYPGAVLTYDSSDKSVATVDASGNVTILAAGETNITLTVPASEDGKFKAYTKTQKLTVNKVEITVTPDAGQWKYEGQADPDTFTYKVSGNFVGDDTAETVISGKLTRESGEAIGKYAYKLDSLTATANYKLVPGGTEKFEIKAKLATTVTLASAVTKTYGDDRFNVGADITASKDGAVAVYVSDNTNVATVDNDGNVTILAAGTAKITVTVEGDYEYKPFSGVQTVTVNKKDITVTANPAGKRVDTADPALTYTYTDLAYDDQLTGKLVRDAGEAIKDYDIKQGTLKIVGADGTTDKSANYNLTFVGAKFTISDKLPQSVTVPAVPTKTYGDEPFSVKATVVTSYEGAVAKYASSNTSVATVDNDGNVTILAAGTAEIIVTVDGNDDYAKFESKQPLTVNKKQITITPDADQWKRIGKADTELTFAYDETLLVETDALTGKLGRAAGEDVGEYAYTLGDLSAGANYELVLAGEAKFEIKDKMEQEVVMPELPKKITYGDASHAFKPISTSVENPTVSYESNNEKVVYVDEDGALVFAGAGKAELTVTVEGDDDYKPYSCTYSLKVNKKQIKIKDFNPATKEITFEGVQDGDVVGLDDDALDVKIITETTPEGKKKTIVTYSNLQADDENYEAVLEYYDVPEEPENPENPPVDPDEPDEPVNVWTPVEIEEGDTSDLANAILGQIVTVKIDSPFGNVTRNGEVVDKQFDTLIGIYETLTAVPKKGYKFTSFTVGGSASKDNPYTFQVNDDVTVRVAYSEIEPESIWIPVFSVVFESNGGTYIPTVKIEGSGRVERPEDPVREGYIFDGWYSDIYLDEEFNFRTELDSFTVLFAKWIKVEEPEIEEPEVPAVPAVPVEPEVPAWQNPFTDVNPADWFYSVVEYVNSKGIMNGVDETLFAPNGQVTRAMFVTMLHRLEGEPTAAQSTFTDVELNAWYTAAINWASANGIVNGTSETTFAPNAAITREQMAAILYRYAAYKKYDVTVKDTALTFTDDDAISDYAMTAIVWAVENGLMQGNGDNTVAPKNAATRAEAAAVLMRAIENIK